MTSRGEGGIHCIADHAAIAPTHRGGPYPPVYEGVCTDVIWRAFRDAGYGDLKHGKIKDIRNALQGLSPSANPT